MNNSMNYNNQKIQLEEIHYILQVSQDLIKVMDMIKVLILWRFRIISMWRGRRNLRRSCDCLLKKVLMVLVCMFNHFFFHFLEGGSDLHAVSN